LVGELDTMQGVNGIDVFISKADLATEETMALSYQILAQMMAGHQAKVAPAVIIRYINDVLMLQQKMACWFCWRRQILFSGQSDWRRKSMLLKPRSAG